MAHSKGSDLLTHRVDIMSVQLDSTIDRTKTLPRASSSSRLLRHGGSRGDKNWRGKYLRALNIYTPEVAFSKEKRGSEGSPKARAGRSDVDCGSLSRSYDSSTGNSDPVPLDVIQSTHKLGERVRPSAAMSRMKARARGHLRTESSAEAFVANGYGFQLRPALSRGRRCHTDPFVLDEHVSAPIQIPQPARCEGALKHQGSSNRLLDRRRESEDRVDAVPAVRLLSWEEPVAMQAAAKALSAGIPIDQTTHTLGINDSVVINDVLVEDYDSSESETEDNDHEDGIFTMEGLDDEMQKPCTRKRAASPLRTRRDRTVSASVVIDEHHREEASLLGRKEELSASFVPPHQMVERDCFSLGLQNEFKRRPARI